MINPMEMRKERILLVESDPQITDLIARQSLEPLGYQVETVSSASSLIKDLASLTADIIITDLYLPEISGKDLLVALSSQGIKIPVIVITSKGHESDTLHAFRLGAVDFINHPVREAEVIKVVEDTLNLHRKQTELDSYSRRLDQSREMLEQRIRDFSEIFTLSKLVVSNASQKVLYEKIINAALRVSQADTAWMVLFDFKKEKYVLAAGLNLPADLRKKMNLPFEDGSTSHVISSGQALSMHGDALSRFDLHIPAGSLLEVPVKSNDNVFGVLAVARKDTQAFSTDHQAMLEMVADYASILIKSSQRIFQQEQRLAQLQQSSIYGTIDSAIKNDILRQASIELRRPLKSLMVNLEALSTQGDRRLSLKQIDAINAIQDEADMLVDIADAMVRIHQGDTSKLFENIDLNEIVRNAVNRSQAVAQLSHVTIRTELPPQPTIARVYSSQITKVIDGLLSNAIKYSPTRAQVSVRVEDKGDSTWVSIQDQGEGIHESLTERLFDKKSNLFGNEARRFGGIGISLPVMKEIITAHNGKIWVESGFGEGFAIIFTLPKQDNTAE